MDVQRSLAAIVFTDVVGFSALCAADEANALRLFEKDLAVMQGVCARNDGQILKTMGDGVLMVFGSAVQAVTSALDIQRAFCAADADPVRLLHRIGIHVGDVLLSQDDAQGDGVNVAARLQAGAPPGGIWISGTVYEIVKTRLAISATALGAQTFKNIAHPVQVFELGLDAPAASKIVKRRSIPKWAPTGGAVFLGLAMLGSAGVVYLASLHQPKQITEVIEPGNRTSASAPKANAAPSLHMDVKKVQPTVTNTPPAPQPPNADNSLKQLSDKVARTAAQLGQRESTLVTPPSNTTVQKSTPTDKQPPLSTASPATPVGQATIEPNRAVVTPTPSKNTTPAKPFDPVVGRSRYEFALYLKWLRAKPNPDSPSNQREINKWRAMTNLKKTAEESLYDHTPDAPLMVTDSSGGSGDLKAWATQGRAGPAHVIVHFQGVNGTIRDYPFGQLSPSQLDGIFLAVGKARFPQPATDNPKRQFQRQLNVFEREYGLPRTNLP